MGDWLGRRWGLIQDAAIMLLGLVMLTASWGGSLQGWVICYAWCLFIYGEIVHALASKSENETDIHFSSRPGGGR